MTTKRSSGQNSTIFQEQSRQSGGALSIISTLGTHDDCDGKKLLSENKSKQERARTIRAIGNSAKRFSKTKGYFQILLTSLLKVRAVPAQNLLTDEASIGGHSFIIAPTSFDGSRK
jgi:hypothetical protein